MLVKKIKQDLEKKLTEDSKNKIEELLTQIN